MAEYMFKSGYEDASEASLLEMISMNKHNKKTFFLLGKSIKLKLR
jgi:hypothetical protein